MGAERPVWRQAFDAVEGAAAPRLAGVLSDERFQLAVGLATAAQRQVQRRTERAMRRTLHLWNLPAGSDVTRILNEIGRLQGEVRQLSDRLDEQREATDVRPAEPEAQPRRPRPARP